MELTNYQKDIRSASGRRIMMAGRQTGKSTIICDEARDRAKSGQRVVVIAINYRMRRELIDMYREINSNDSHVLVGGGITIAYDSGEINFVAATDIESSRKDVLDYKVVDAVLVDEANRIDQSILFELDKGDLFGNVSGILLTATPFGEKTIVEIWAEHSPYWDTFHVPSTDAPYIDESRIEELYGSMYSETYQNEIEANFMSNGN